MGHKEIALVYVAIRCHKLLNVAKAGEFPDKWLNIYLMKQCYFLEISLEFIYTFFT